MTGEMHMHFYFIISWAENLNKNSLGYTFAALPIISQFESIKTFTDVGVRGADTLMPTAVIHRPTQIQTWNIEM